MDREVVKRLLDRLALGEIAKVLCQQRGIERIGAIEVLVCTLDERQVAEIVVVRIEPENGSTAEFAGNMLGEVTLSSAGWPGNSDEVWSQLLRSSFFAKTRSR